MSCGLMILGKGGGAKDRLSSFPVISQEEGGGRELHVRKWKMVLLFFFALQLNDISAQGNSYPSFQGYPKGGS